MAIKHVTTDADGWLVPKYTAGGGTYPPLPQFLRVSYLRLQDGRDYFTILEGRSAGKEASVKIGRAHV